MIFLYLKAVAAAGNPLCYINGVTFLAENTQCLGRFFVPIHALQFLKEPRRFFVGMGRFHMYYSSILQTLERFDFPCFSSSK